MFTQQTKEKLLDLNLAGFIQVLDEVAANPSMATSLDINDVLGLMVDREFDQRDNRRFKRLMKAAKLRYPHACIENIDYQQPREFNQQQLRQLVSCQWIQQSHNLVLRGPTGVGKSFIACALGQQACRMGLSTRYFRTTRLNEQFRVAHADGSYQRLLSQLAKTQLLILDDWGIDQLNRQARQDILEVLEDRASRGSTLLTTQLPTEHWHEYIGDSTIADAICDRLLHRAYTISITGDSMRKTEPTLDSCRSARHSTS